jgi:hypothetical protein
MLYMMKQKLFSWGDDFIIKDENGKDRFFVDGKAFSLGNQLSFQDMAGNELAYIRQKLPGCRGIKAMVYAGRYLRSTNRARRRRCADPGQHRGD